MSIRNLGNKFTFTTSNISPTQTFQLPTMFFPSNIGMDFFTKPFPNNYNKIRNKSLSTKENIFKDSSMSFTKSSVAYYERIECNNIIIIDKEIDDISPVLFYEKK